MINQGKSLSHGLFDSEAVFKGVALLLLLLADYGFKTVLVQVLRMFIIPFSLNIVGNQNVLV